MKLRDMQAECGMSSAIQEPSLPARQRFPFDVVVFDLDGTLANTAADLSAALNHMLWRMGRTQVPAPQVIKMVGGGMRNLLERGFAATGGATPALVEEGVPIFLDYYEAHIADESRPYSGAEAALDVLLERGVRLAICSNKPEKLTHRLLSAFGWTERFASVIGGDTLPERKPQAEPLWEAIRRAGGGRGVLVGDSITDVEAAAAASLPCVAVSFGFRDRPADELGATCLIDDFEQLMPTLERLGSGAS